MNAHRDEDVEIDSSHDFGIFGLLCVLTQDSSGGSFYDLSTRTTQQLVTIVNQGKNIGEMTSLALSAVSQMIMHHDHTKDSFNNVGVGGLIELLTDLGQAGAVIESNAAHALEKRGYSASGKCLAARTVA